MADRPMVLRFLGHHSIEKDQPGTAEVALREADLRDEIEAIERRQHRIALTPFAFYLILAVALIEGTFGLPAAALGVLLLVPIKKARMRYRALASEKTDLLSELDSVGRLEGERTGSGQSILNGS